MKRLCRKILKYMLLFHTIMKIKLILFKTFCIGRGAIMSLMGRDVSY